MMISTLSPQASAAVRGPLRILLADDNETLRAAVRGLLQRLGHTVDTVANGREVIESEARKEFDVVFLDVQMPEMDGVAAARSLRRGRAGRHRLRIIGFSGDCSERESCAAVGMDAFLPKPVRLADLVQVLRDPHEH